MKTYPLNIIRLAFHDIIDRNKFVRFTVYFPRHRPLKVKAKIWKLYGDEKGLKILFDNVYLNRKLFMCVEFYTRDIRWITCPFDISKLEERCMFHVKRLNPNNGRMIPLSPNALIR
jgi:hypothetical protein